MDEIHLHLDTLGLKPGVTPDEAKQAYRDLMMVWHPDRFPADSRLQQLAQEKAKQINIAYDKLKSYRGRVEPRIDPVRRSPTEPSGANRQGQTSGGSPHFDSQQGRPRQSSTSKTKTGHVRPDEAALGRVPTSDGLLLIVFAGVSGGLLVLPPYPGDAPWKVLLLGSLMGISLCSLVKARREHPQLTLLNYLKTFASVTFWICVCVAFLAAWLLIDNKSQKTDA